jgi:branched-chain amino acid transport system permease protein
MRGRSQHVAAAGAIVTLKDPFADTVGSLVAVIMGAIFVVCVLLFCRGIVG